MLPMKKSGFSQPTGSRFLFIIGAFMHGDACDSRHVRLLCACISAAATSIPLESLYPILLTADTAVVQVCDQLSSGFPSVV